MNRRRLWRIEEAYLGRRGQTVWRPVGYLPHGYGGPSTAAAAVLEFETKHQLPPAIRRARSTWTDPLLPGAA